jgi:hypothetical protein
MTDRAKLLRIYGPELLAEEARAIEGMLRMLNYQQSIDYSQLHDGGSGAVAEDEVEDRSTQARNASNAGASGFNNNTISLKEFVHVLSSIENNKPKHGSEASDIFLPPFVRKAMEEMLLAESKESTQVFVVCLLFSFFFQC